MSGIIEGLPASLNVGILKAGKVGDQITKPVLHRLRLAAESVDALPKLE